MKIDLQNLIAKSPTWPGKCVDMRSSRNKTILKAARNTKHVRRGAYSSPNSFTGVKVAWEFSNELLAEAAKE
jgi:hypothetical protein